MDAPPKVDRESTTPFLLKLFYKTGAFHRVDEFNNVHADLPPHLQIYTWPTCTLRELSHILLSADPDLLPDPPIGTRISFRLVYADTRTLSAPASAPARYMTKDLGSVVIGSDLDDHNGRYPVDAEEEVMVSGTVLEGPLDGEPHMMLQDASFVIGDYVTCAILPPGEEGDVAPPIREAYNGRRGGYGFGAREPREFGGRRGFGSSDNVNGMPLGGYGGGGRRGGRGGFGGGFGGGGGMGVPQGEWRRGERIPDGPGRGGFRGGGGGWGRGRY